MRRLVTLGLLLACSQVRADAVAELVETLTKLPGKEPVTARIAVTYLQRSASDTDKRLPGTVSVEAATTPSGLRMQFSRKTLDAALAESRQTDPEARRPVSAALKEVSALEVENYLNASPDLLRSLRRATLVSESDATWKGKPVRLLRIALDPQLSRQQQKYVKKLEATAEVWIGSDGVPLAAKQSVDLSGRAMLVVSFESSVRESLEFERRGDRLVVLRQQTEEKSSGGGESGSETTDARVTLVPGAASVPSATRPSATRPSATRPSATISSETTSPETMTTETMPAMPTPGTH